MQKEIKFYIYCLIYPKEMIATRIEVYDEEVNLLKRSKRLFRLRKIKELHDFLYRFSMEKLKKFFEIPPLRIIFKYYISFIDERISLSQTLLKNKEVYKAAINILNNKVLQ